MLSVVIPAFKEGENVQKTIKEVDLALSSWQKEREILLIDDGSPDDTLSQAKKLESNYPCLKVIHLPQNQGPGAAMRAGFQHSKGETIVTIDCDLSYHPKNIHRLVENLSGHDVIVGSPNVQGGKMVNVPFLRKFFSKMAFFLDRFVLGGKLPCYTSFFVAYRGSLIRNLVFKNDSFSAQTEIFIRLWRRGAKISGIPCDLIWFNEGRASSMRLLRESIRHLKLWWHLNRFRKSIN